MFVGCLQEKISRKMNINKKNIAVTGYYGTGSSAVIDLLREYKGVEVVPDCGHLYEHEIFYYPGGLFDLCSLLTNGNTPQGSDIAINNFIDTMRRLNNYDYVWYGSFRRLFGDKVMKMTDEFVNAISERRNGSNSFHYVKTRFSIVKAMMQLAARIVYGKRFSRYGVKYVGDGRPVYFSMPSEDELYEAVKKFTSSYFQLFDKENVTMKIYDHLIWPQQVNAHKRCFDDNLKIIVVNRDPRDVFLSSKYIWCKPPIGRGEPHFGNDFSTFVKEWKRTTVKNIENPNALQIYFEDLVYNYEETVDIIEKFLGVSDNEHINKKARFQPEKSIENTQVFRTNDKWYSETKDAADMLNGYLYEFPYERQPQQKLMFDSPNS